MFGFDPFAGCVQGSQSSRTRGRSQGRSNGRSRGRSRGRRDKINVIVIVNKSRSRGRSTRQY